MRTLAASSVLAASSCSSFAVTASFACAWHGIGCILRLGLVGKPLASRARRLALASSSSCCRSSLPMADMLHRSQCCPD